MKEISVLSVEERNKLKSELKLEIIKEIEEDKKDKLAWRRFKNNELMPLLKNRFESRDCHRISDALATFARCKYRKKSAISFKREDMDVVKSDIYKLLEFWFDMKEI